MPFIRNHIVNRKLARLTKLCFVAAGKYQVFSIDDFLPHRPLRPEIAPISLPPLTVRKSLGGRHGDAVVNTVAVRSRAVQP